MADQVKPPIININKTENDESSDSLQFPSWKSKSPNEKAFPSFSSCRIIDSIRNLTTLDQLLPKNCSSCNIDNITPITSDHQLDLHKAKSSLTSNISHSSNVGFVSNNESPSYHKNLYGKYGIGCLWRIAQDTPTDIGETPISDSINVNPQFPYMHYQFQPNITSKK